MEKTIRICMAGFGHVGQRFCRLLQEQAAQLAQNYHCQILLTGVCTRSKGLLLHPDGLDLTQILTSPWQQLPGWRSGNVLDMIACAQADIFLELTTLDIKKGQPATDHIQAAFNHNMHVITANKGPLAWHFKELSRQAQQKQLAFYYETTVMDGAPIFNLAANCLPGDHVCAIRGILNGTSNFVLHRLAAGDTLAEAIRQAQAIELAEADPSMDIDGYDAAAKICALANVLMQANQTPQDVQIEGIRHISATQLAQAKEDGYCLKPIASATKAADGSVQLRVAPQRIAKDDWLAHIDATSAALELSCQLCGDIAIVQRDPAILQTAYGVYSDMLQVISHHIL